MELCHGDIRSKCVCLAVRVAHVLIPADLQEVEAGPQDIACMCSSCRMYSRICISYSVTMLGYV